MFLHAVVVVGESSDAPAGLARELPAFGAVGRALRRAVRRRLVSASPLSEAQVGVLRTVEARPGVSSGAVAERLQLAPSTVSTLLRELVDAGLVRREIDERNRRASRLWLTEQAQSRLHLWSSVSEEVLATALAELDAADRVALQQALPAARRLAAALEDL